MNKKTFIYYIYLIALTYTIAVVMNCIIFLGPQTSMSTSFLLQLLICIILIYVILYFVNRLPIDSALLLNALVLLSDTGVVLGLGGGVFHWFSWKWENIGRTVLMVVIAFAVINGLSYWQNKGDAKKINGSLKESRREKDSFDN